MASVYQTTALGLGPSLYWPLNAAGGATDQSGNGHDGTGAGSVSIGGFASSPVTGETSTDFDGTDDRVASATYNPFVNGTTRTFTGWANRDTTTNYNTLYGDGSGLGGGGAWLVLAQNTQEVFYSNDGNLTNTSWGLGVWPGNGQWVHWALVFNETTDAISLYLDGALIEARTYTTAYTANNYLSVGLYSNFASMDGKMAHFAVYEKGLTAPNIAKLNAAGSAIHQTDMLLMGAG